jgi:hypothetical protein
MYLGGIHSHFVTAEHDKQDDENVRVNSFTCPLIQIVWIWIFSDICRTEMYNNSHMTRHTFNPKLLFP